MNPQQRFQPFKNEKGIAVLAMVIIVGLLVVSYTIYAAAYYRVLDREVRRLKTSVIGISLLEDVAQAVVNARQQFIGSGCPSGPGNVYDTLVGGQLCIKGIAQPNRLCVSSTFVTGPAQICIDREVVGGAGITIEVSDFDDRSIFEKELEPFRDLTERYGKWIAGVTHSFSGQAFAIIADQDLPAIGAPPAFTRTRGACAAGAAAPTTFCMRCFSSDPGGGAAKPHCVRMKVCVRPGGVCAAAVNGQWFWQMIALTGSPDPP